MKDSLALLATAIVMSFFAWLFWSSLGQDASTVLGTLMLVLLSIENYRLRRQVRALLASKSAKT
ncbi:MULTISPECIES: hypothetical protein [Pseudomonas syringae group]|uniref:Uncharacterized protein n=1 Tax=Pseudomonas syringae pv. viburni TaxID=251703 RepID=A0A0Q0JCY8_9PSED|nr:MULTISPECIES: hypothetical protein [Pseudomonas syringae group]KPZ12332.1 Uncharacterized protein ALO40_05644 [Pseudomonas syringae pv. viburni]